MQRHNAAQSVQPRTFSSGYKQTKVIDMPAADEANALRFSGTPLIKCCSQCKEPKLHREFARNRSRLSGFESRCKCCKTAAMANRVAALISSPLEHSPLHRLSIKVCPVSTRLCTCLEIGKPVKLCTEICTLRLVLNSINGMVRQHLSEL